MCTTTQRAREIASQALIGEVGMSSALEGIANALFNGTIPAMWMKLAPATLKNLANWITHFQRRYDQYHTWVENGEPAVIWLSGLHIPESYLTALVQATCKCPDVLWRRVLRPTVYL